MIISNCSLEGDKVCVHLHGECQKLSQSQLRPFCCPEIRRAGAQLQEEAVQSLCRDLLQPQACSTRSSLVLNTLSWERTEVIASPGPDGAETLGMSDLAVALVSGFTTGKCSASPSPGDGLLTAPFVLWTA